MVDEEGRIRFANPAITRMLGCQGGELTGSQLLDWVDVAGPVQWQASSFYQHWQRREHLRLHDANLRTREGAAVPVALSCSPLPHDGHWHGSAGVGHVGGAKRGGRRQ
ncbi:PAS domain-containing protein [Pseudomonas sp. D2-3]